MLREFRNEAMIVGGALVGYVLMRRQQTQRSGDACLEGSPLVQASGFAQPLIRLSRLERPLEFANLVAKIEAMLKMLQGKDGPNGFYISRIADEIEREANRLVHQAQQLPDHQKAIRAMSSADDVECIARLCQDMLHNFLIERMN